MQTRPAIREESVGKGLNMPVGRPQHVLLGGLLTLLSVTAWMVLIVNRYMTIHEGWFSYYGYLMKRGEFPYRDFYFFTQPLHLLIAHAVVEIGDKVIYYRYYGLVERIVITAVLYFLLSRSFSAAAAVCGTVASSILFLAYQTDAFSSYFYTCLLFALISPACFYAAWQNSARRSLWMALAGVAASLSFFSKQSNGLLIIVAGAVTLSILSESIQAASSDLLKYFLGVAVAAVPFVWWLAWNGAWNAYVTQVFRGAASSKGGLHAVLFGFLPRQITPASIGCFVAVLAALGALLWFKQVEFLAPGRQTRQIPEWVAFAAVAASMLGTIVAVHRIAGVPLWVMTKSTDVLVNMILYSLLPVLAYILYRRFIRCGSQFVRRDEVPIALLITSCFWTYGCGMSWSVAEQSLIPSLGLLLAFSYDRLQFREGRAMSVLVLTASLLIISLGAWHKWNVAFNWEGWFETVSENGSHSKHAEIADYKLDPAEIVIYDTILDDIARYTNPGESIVTFPSIPLFNYVGDHLQPTFAAVHYWDVCPDDVARRDAERVKAARPRMIVELRLAEWVWREHDQGWRGGRRSGQRDFQDALDYLTSSGDYKLLRSFLTPVYRMPVQVWLREH